jgi:integrase/recombinase XerD
MASRTRRDLCCHLRVLLRFCHREGITSRDLSGAVGTPQVYRLDDVPRSISWDEVRRMLEAVERRTIRGRRDYAILLLLVTYGLRAHEVAKLILDDVDWKRERLQVLARKAGHATAYPLAGVVAEAIIDYHTGRHGRGRDRSLCRLDAEEQMAILGLRPAMLESLPMPQGDFRRPITRLILSDLSAQRVLDFLHMIEVTRGNHVSTRNQRLAALHTFYRYVGLQYPEMLAEAQRVEAIPMKRTAPPQTDYLEHDEIETLFKSLPRQGILWLRDRAIFMVLYNTGARVQEIADLHIADVDLSGPLRIRLHGKGDKWRSCPLWPETAELLKRLIADVQGNQSSPLFRSRQRKPLTRFGIYKIVKRHTAGLRHSTPEKKYRGVSPHVFRHSTAVGLLEQGVDVNVIRAWLGHVSLETTYRYEEITLRGKMAAVAACLPPVATSVPSRRSDGSHKDEELLKWLDSL